MVQHLQYALAPLIQQGSRTLTARQLRADVIPMQTPPRPFLGPKASSTSQSIHLPLAGTLTSIRVATVPTLLTTLNTPWKAPLSTTQPTVRPSWPPTALGGLWRPPFTPPLAAPTREPLSINAWSDLAPETISALQRALQAPGPKLHP